LVKHEFKRNERLKSVKVIAQLFKKNKPKPAKESTGTVSPPLAKEGEGNSFAAYPIRIVWRDMTEESPDTTFPVQMALTVPKKVFKTAVARNVLRRRIREAYRLNKHKLYDKLPKDGKQYAIMLLYTGKEAMSYQIIEQSIQKIIKRFVQTVCQS
jgi:ribonuclease P protein component